MHVVGVCARASVRVCVFAWLCVWARGPVCMEGNGEGLCVWARGSVCVCFGGGPVCVWGAPVCVEGMCVWTKRVREGLEGRTQSRFMSRGEKSSPRVFARII